MKKMLYILGFYPINGRCKKNIEAIQKYNEIEIKPIFWNMTGLKNEINDMYIFTQRVKHTKIKKLLNIFYYGKFIRSLIKEEKPDYIIAYHWDIMILVKICLFGLESPIFIYEVSDIPGYSGILHFILKKIEEFFIYKKDILVLASRFFEEKYKNKNKKIVIDNKPEKIFLNNKTKYNLNLKNDYKNISFIGVYRDLEIFKNIIDSAEGKKMNLLFFGEGAIKEELSKYIKGKKNIYLYGRYNYEEIPSLYNISDAIISLYSNRDQNTNLATGNKFFKVQAFKKIGIFPKGTKMGDYMEKNQLGLVVDPYSKIEIKKAFDDIIQETDTVKKIMNNLKKINNEEIFWENERKKWRGVLEKRYDNKS